MKTNSLWPGQDSFFVGCNYWASHAGTAMWSDWRPDVVERDLQLLSEQGLEVLRVFPLWPDFQPIATLYGGHGHEMDIRLGERRLPDDEMGRAGLSQEAMGKFREFADIARRQGLQLIVGLVTGWMSGRLFVPPALQGRNVLTDPQAIQWQVRFVNGFVRATKDHPAIVAWDLGNECNAMGPVRSSSEAFVWTSALSGAIKSADPGRPLISGMHGLSPTGNWRMQDQGELTDILTTHPYPYWTPYADYDPITTIRPQLHATAENLYYGQIGGKPCFAEEIGTMGPMVSGEAEAAAFLRGSMLSLWAHGCHGLLWWCAFDQMQLPHAPYDSNACEGELGLVTEQGRAKPTLREMDRLRRVFAGLPTLPPRRTEAVCIVGSSQEHWPVAFGSFMLAKQAGFDLIYRFEDQPLPDAKLYMLPCVSGTRGIPKLRWLELLERVSGGADLYVSVDDGYLLEFERATGLEVRGRGRRSGETVVTMLAGESECAAGGFPVAEASFKLEVRAVRARVLATEKDGNPVFTVANFGQGRIFFLSVPLELELIRRPEACYRPDAFPYWTVYEAFAERALSERAIRVKHPLVGMTEHDRDRSSRLAVLVNHAESETVLDLRLADAWTFEECLYGEVLPGAVPRCTLAPSDGAVVLLRKR
ncbi:glycoside hydrolase 5 family protein [Cohnella zeiphila]|uniref:Beta-mannanase n=1 Tax=Cohnella zeiphila TaxID=2761120 RepID=A0A7X0SGY6_9BACL|nr:glycoside hydrolase family 2 TIM barrel-domain containing protein [Cohnella zeiphila]MBB6729800.1 beta-mannanase [Cohnella zeiphila]